MLSSLQEPICERTLNKGPLLAVGPLTTVGLLKTVGYLKTVGALTTEGRRKSPPCERQAALWQPRSRQAASLLLLPPAATSWTAVATHGSCCDFVF